MASITATASLEIQALLDREQRAERSLAWREAWLLLAPGLVARQVRRIAVELAQQHLRVLQLADRVQQLRDLSEAIDPDFVLSDFLGRFSTRLQHLQQLADSASRHAARVPRLQRVHRETERLRQVIRETRSSVQALLDEVQEHDADFAPRLPAEPAASPEDFDALLERLAAPH